VRQGVVSSKRRIGSGAAASAAARKAAFAEEATPSRTMTMCDATARPARGENALLSGRSGQRTARRDPTLSVSVTSDSQATT